ncbi:hypothetical protein [Mycolicibacter arupensis]|uniref:hypothetical protein n=1 Tax=Mycolicibacter arupensis TaxID=342002 RepID=UPI0010387199|nr:hypothetical protein [Mycolicibacter arupensis]MCV7274494.1 hypothetical protein [Mycolicibacter arupensis]
MAILGICVVPSAGAPKLYGVLARGTFAEPEIVDTFEVRTNSDQPADQAVDLARLLQAKLPGLEFTAAAIRVAGTRPVGSRQKAAFSRAHAEGAALYVIREHLKSPVVTGDHKALAKMLGVPSADLEMKSKELAKSKADAALAALSQLPKS